MPSGVKLPTSPRFRGPSRPGAEPERVDDGAAGERRARNRVPPVGGRTLRRSPAPAAVAPGVMPAVNRG